MYSKLWLVIAAIVSLGVLAMGWFIGISPNIDAMNDANEQRASVDQQNVLYRAKLKQLEKQFAQIDDLRSELADAQLGLPPGDDLSSFLGQLHALETKSGVTLNKFSASDAEVYIPAPDAVVSPLVTAGNFVAITIDLSVKGSRAQVIDFVSDLQNGKRLFLVTNLSIAQDKELAEDGETFLYTGSITGYVYVLVDPSAPPPSPTPVGSLDTKETPTPSPAP